jgi:predicted nucleic acid-binding protein
VLVVDTSALLEALVARDRPAGLLERLASDDLGAPHLLDVEVLSGLRRLVATGQLSDDRANDARGDFAAMPIVRYPHGALSDRAWELRHNLTAHDAVYVALAEVLDIPLVTCDRKLGTAPGHRATVEVFPPARGT